MTKEMSREEIKQVVKDDILGIWKGDFWAWMNVVITLCFVALIVLLEPFIIENVWAGYVLAGSYFLLIVFCLTKVYRFYE